MILLPIDIVLASTLVALVLCVLAARTRTESVIVFMVFGLVMALAWVRVDAPDLAIAEAAIGSGVTGALLLGALRRLRPHTPRTAPKATAPPWLRRLAALGCLAIGGVLTAAITVTWSQPAPMTALVHTHLPASGVQNPVTAVILNFRAYDTWLEIGVLLIAAIGVSVCGKPRTPLATDDFAIPVLQFFVRWLRPSVLLVAIYLVWVGDKAPGGAFQAGALLGGAGVVMLLSGGASAGGSTSRGFLRVLLALGFLVFTLVALLMLCREALLAYPAHQAKHWILVIELACTVSIGTILMLLFATCAGLRNDLGTGGSLWP